MRSVFMTGGTGYMGSRLIPMMASRGYELRGLVRPGSEARLPQTAAPVVGDALRGESYAASVHAGDTFVHLAAVPHPSPAKAKQFREIDLVGTREAVRVAKDAGVAQFVYVSVAHPAPAMKAYIAVRMECEAMIRESGMNATILRPWYVLGPGHWWPYALIPFYKLAEILPATREAATRLGLVTLAQMLAALQHAVETPAQGIRIVDVPGIRAAGQ
jgi:nucleoside-diphosphate-sugar epimerase